MRYARWFRAARRGGRPAPAPEPAPSRPGALVTEALESRLMLDAVPAAPSDLRLQWVEPGRVSITFRDNATNERGFSIDRQDLVGNTSGLVGGADLPPNAPADPSAVGDVTVYDTDPSLNPASVYVYTVSVLYGVNNGVVGPSGRVAYAPQGSGLRQRIWNDVDPQTFEPIGQPIVDRVDPIVDHAWGDGPPAPGVDPDTFAVEWTGQILGHPDFPLDLWVVANDGVRLFINDRLLLAGGWRDQPETEYAVQTPWNAGPRLNVRLQTYDHTGPATAQLYWQSDGRREIIPSQSLIPVSDDTLRTPTEAHAAGLAAVDGTTVDRIVVSWQDNAFGESGYEIQRSTRRDFSDDLQSFTAPTGATQYFDSPAEFRTYYYRVRARAAGRTSAWSATTCAVKSSESEGFSRTQFTTRGLTYNGFATPTGQGTLKLAHERSGGPGTAFFNQTVRVNDRLLASFDFIAGTGDGLTFILQDVLPPAGGSQLNAIGGAFGYEGIGARAAALKLDFARQQIGFYAGGTLNNDVEPDTPGTPHRPNVAVALGPTGVFLNPFTRYRVSLDYRRDDHGTYGDPSDDTGVLSIKLSRVDFPATDLFSTQYDVLLPDVLGGDFAQIGFGASGPAVVAPEVWRFDYSSGIIFDRFPPTVYARGSAWSNGFKGYLASSGLGDASLGVRVSGFGPTRFLPWINMDQVIVQGIYRAPEPRDLEILGTRGSYAVRSVELVPGTSDTYAFTLDKPLGGSAGAGLNGDRLLLRLYPCDCCHDGAPEPPDQLRLNVVQGDVGQSGSVVANDFSSVKRKFFRTAAAPGTPGDSQYTPFHDVDGNGAILANDFSEVRKRFFNTLPPATATAAAAPPALFGRRRLRPPERSALAV